MAKKRAKKRSSKKPAKRKVKAKSRPKRKPVKRKAVRAVKKTKKSAARKPIKKATKVKTTKKTAVVKKPAAVQLPLVGKVIHYYDQISVGVVHVEKPLRVNDKIRIGKQDRFFEQEIKSMQVNRQPISEAKKGQEIGLKVKKRVRQNDLVWKV